MQLFAGAAWLCCCTSSAPATATLPSGFSDQTIVQGLDLPVGLAFLPDGRLLFTEQFTAQVRLVVRDTIATTDPVMTVPNVRTADFEQGLLGIAVDPGWPARPYIYLHFEADPVPYARVSRFTMAGDLSNTGDGTLTGDVASRYDILIVDPDFDHHDGGTLRFGPDGMLYLSLGEDHVPCAAQDVSSMRGCILRLDVTGLPAGPGGPPPLASLIPAGNPFPGPDDTARLKYVLGLRNPFRFHIDAATGNLFITDVGESTYEEVDWVTSGGLNFGWPFREGPAPAPPISCPGVTPGSYTEPIAHFVHNGSASIVSGGVYRTPSAPSSVAFPGGYDGDYFFADYYEGFLRRIRYSGGPWSPAPAAPGQPNDTDWATGLTTVTDFLEASDGSLWYSRQFDDDYNPTSGSIHRILGDNVASVPSGTAPLSRRLWLSSPHPNPASHGAVLELRLAQQAQVRALVHDLQGRTVRSLLDRVELGPGAHVLAWDGLDVAGRPAPSGVYLVNLSSGSEHLSRRVAITR